MKTNPFAISATAAPAFVAAKTVGVGHSLCWRRSVTLVGVAVVGLTTAGVVLAASSHACRPDLERLAAQFQAIGFEDVVNPGQAHVRGAGGHDHTGGEIRYIQSQIRQAFVDCDAGRESAVRERIAAARAELQMGHG